MQLAIDKRVTFNIKKKHYQRYCFCFFGFCFLGGGCIVLFVLGFLCFIFIFSRESNYSYSWRQSSPYKKIQQIQKFNFCTFHCRLVVEWLTDNRWHKFIEKIGTLLSNFKMVTGWFMFRFRREPLCKSFETNDDFAFSLFLNSHREIVQNQQTE